MPVARTTAPRPVAGLVVCIAVLLVGTFFFHRYSILTGLDVVEADTGDSRFVAAILEHWNNVLHGTATWTDVPMFWPAQHTLAYSDASFGMGVLHAALRTGLGLFEAINAQLILLTVLSYAATLALLTRGLRLSLWGATLGAAFATFCWQRFAYLPHIQLQFTAPLPLLFLLLIEAFRDGLSLPRRAVAWRFVAAAALMALLLSTTVYYAVYAALTVCVALALCLLHGPTRRHLLAVGRRQWPGLLAGAAVLVLLVAPVVQLYLPLARESGGRSWAEVFSSLPRPRHFIWMGQENWVWGGFFARHWSPAEIAANWAEFRIGVGAVASLAWLAGVVWAVVWALGTLRRTARTRDGLLALLILTGAVLQLLMLALPGGHSAWWLIWRYFPGANGLRAVARLEIVVSLAMAAWLGALLDRAIRDRRTWPKAAASLLIALCAVEQFGRTDTFDGHAMEVFEQRVAAQLVAPCPAIFVMGTPDLRPLPITDESRFDAAAYLAANPDIAANWKGSAWSHYEQFGRNEGRVLDRAAAYQRKLLAVLGYNYTLPLAAVLAHKPVVNGLSGTEPPGWHLADVLGADPEVPLRAWLAQRGVPPGSVCTLPLRISLDMIPFRPPGFWP